MSWRHANNIVVYVPEYFQLHEVFPPDMINGHKGNYLWSYMHQAVNVTIDRLRERYGKAYMNTWGFNPDIQKVYGTHYFRGWRSKDCDVGASLSQHKMGCAADMAFVHVTTESIREDILAQPSDEAFEYITCIEMEVNWLHFDCRPRDKANKGILQVFP